MAILVVCTACKTRFQVSEKFAGKQGPCPKCKTVLSVPKLEDQVKIHAPEEYSGGAAVAAKDAKGRAVLKPLAREKTKVQPIMIVGVAAGVVVTLLIAIVIGISTQPDGPSPWILGAGAALLAPPLVIAGYTFLRDQEMEAYRGVQLLLRAAIVSSVYAALWGLYAYYGSYYPFVNGTREMWMAIPIAGVMLVIGSLTALGALDLEPTNAFFHYVFYLTVTVLLRLVMQLPPL
ncbi:MAG: hypothetical protein SGJ20_08260 [Planctomycetota bacterium]|nr:hypothetical protein [Planctomycetota bacterium]